MSSFEDWLPWLVLVFTAVSIILLLLPSSFGSEYRFVKTGSQSEVRVQLVVLGDIGRSPRIQYHALSIAKHKGLVDLIGYKASDLHPDIQTNPNVTVHSLAAAPGWLKTDKQWLFMFLAPLKVVHQTCSLFYALGYRTPPAKWLLVQNPPTIPTLLIAQIICFIRNTRLIIDWHNFGFSILGLKLGSGHPLVGLSELFERTFCAKASAHLVVSDAMGRVLKAHWRLRGPILTLHDRPFAHFQPFNENQRMDFLASCSETAFAIDEIRSGKTKVLVSSTSWTPDEDFSLLLAALLNYAKLAASTQRHLPDILAVITGKGPQKEAFLSNVKIMADQGRLKKVHLRTAWLSAEDYAKLLASADLGVSLHTSSSGVDLPMKVVDMLGVGLPVIGWNDFLSWPELIQDGINGRGFHTSAALSELLVGLFGQDSKQLKRLREGAMLEGKRRWDDEWDPIAGKLLGLCT
ncbi:MAG: hypothetical protein LQ346_000002 [Caloplaca aetnensis]|nr:MAG: hypothetical protein LQ346_000002 [Caloplaca aetnensis]